MEEEGQIEKPRPDLVRKEPLPVPGDFEFVEMDMTDDTQVSRLILPTNSRFKKYTNYCRVITSKMKAPHSVSPTPHPSSNGIPSHRRHLT